MRHMLVIAGMVVVVLGFAPGVVDADDPPDVPAAPWIDDRIHGGIVYLLYSHPARLERFDLVNDLWLPTVDIPQTPSLFDVGDDGIFVGFRSGRVSRLDHLGGNELPLVEMATEPSSATAIGEVLLVINNYLDDAYTFSTSTGALIDFDGLFHHRMVALAPVPSLGRVFGSLDSRPGYLELGPYGHIGLQERNFSDPYLLAEIAWASPDSSFVVFDTGELRFTEPFEAMPVDLGGPLDGLVFFGDLPIVLRDDRLIGYSRSFHRTGEVDLGFTARRVRLHNDSLAVFHLGSSGVEVMWIPVADLHLPPADEPVDPRGLGFTPEGVEIDHRGIVSLLSRTYQSVFRYSTADGSYLETIPTNGRATMIAFSPVDDHLFIGYESGRVGRVQLGPAGEPPPEVAHLEVPGSLYGLTAAGEYLLTADEVSGQETVRTHDASGAPVSEIITYYRSPEYQWCAATRRVYYIDPSLGRLFYNPIDPSGLIGPETSSASDYGIRAPIRINENGSKVLLKYGDIYDGHSLVWLEETGASHLDAVWIGSDIVTVVDDGGDSRLIAYTSDLSVIAETVFPGPPVKLLRNGDEIVLVSGNPSGRPVFSRWSPGLVSTDLLIHVDDGEDLIPAGDPLTWSVSISSPASGAGTGFAVTSAPSAHLTDLSWTCTATPPSACGAPTGIGALTDTATVDPAGTLAYLVTATVASATQGTARMTVRVDPVSGPGSEDTDLTEIWDPLETFADGFEDGTSSAWTGGSP